MAIQIDDSDSITVSEQSEPSAECWQNMYKLLNFYSLISDPTGILEKSSPENCLSGGSQLPAASFQNPTCHLQDTFFFIFSFTFSCILLQLFKYRYLTHALLYIFIFIYISLIFNQKGSVGQSILLSFLPISYLYLISACFNSWRLILTYIFILIL